MLDVWLANVPEARVDYVCAGRRCTLLRDFVCAFCFCEWTTVGLREQQRVLRKPVALGGALLAAALATGAGRASPANRWTGAAGLVDDKQDEDDEQDG